MTTKPSIKRLVDAAFVFGMQHAVIGARNTAARLMDGGDEAGASALTCFADLMTETIADIGDSEPSSDV